MRRDRRSTEYAARVAGLRRIFVFKSFFPNLFRRGFARVLADKANYFGLQNPLDGKINRL